MKNKIAGIGNVCLALLLLISVGAKANATAIQIGLKASAVPDSIAIGVSSVTRAPGAIAVGFRSASFGKNSAVFGHNSIARSSGNVVLGENLVADGEGSMILGRSSSPIANSVPNSFAVNFFSKTPTLFVAGGPNGVAGRVGVNTNTPTATLDVKGDISSNSLKTNTLTSTELVSKSAKIDALTNAELVSKSAKTDILTSTELVSKSAKIDALTNAELVSKSAKIDNITSNSAKFENISSNLATHGEAKIKFIDSESVRSQNVVANKLIKTPEISSKKIQTTDLLAEHIKSNVISNARTFLKHLDVSDAASESKGKEDLAILSAHLDTSFDSSSSKHEEQLKMLTNNKMSTEKEAKKYYSLYENEKSKIPTNYDVDGNGIINNDDPQEIINYINKFGSNPPYLAKYDINLDKNINSMDALIIINFLNSNSNLSEYYLNLYEKHASIVSDLERQIDEILKGAGLAARVGVGTRTPQQTLHINGAARLEPLEVAPINASMGDLYMDKSGALCVYIYSWEVVAGKGYCNEDFIMKPWTKN